MEIDSFLENTYFKTESYGHSSIDSIKRKYDDVIEEYTNSRFDDLFIEHNIIKANVLLENDKFRRRFDEYNILRLKGKIGDFIRLMGEDYMPEETVFMISAYVDNAVKVEFKNLSHVFLTIYDNHVEEGALDVEEAFLSYVVDKRKKLEYDTMGKIVNLLKDLMRK